MDQYSIVYGDKVQNFATARSVVAAFIEATVMIDNQINGSDSHIEYETVTHLGEEIVVYRPGTQYEVRLHGLSHAEWDVIAEMTGAEVTLN
jgi:predicted metal-dependent enzyme (double-stranded beta helix superfamily)